MLWEKIKYALGFGMPRSLGKVSNNVVYTTLSKQLGTKNLLLSDAQFDVCNVNDAQAYCVKTQVSAAKYIAEGHDCDNFSFAMQGYWSEGLLSFAFGICWSQDHAFNVMLDPTGQVWIVEPQTNQFLTIAQAKKAGHYFPVQVVMM